MDRPVSTPRFLLVTVLCALQVHIASPLLAQDAGTQTTSQSAPSTSTVVTTPPPPAPKVTVNRRVPDVTPPPSTPQFSASPTVDEIFRARIFREPIVPVGGMPTPEETAALARALVPFHAGGATDWRSSIGMFLMNHPSTVWRASLLANLGVIEAREHAYARALDQWQEAWTLAKDFTDTRSRAVADFAVAEWLTVTASFGVEERVAQKLAEIGDRPIAGSAGAKIARAREQLALITRERQKLLPCAAGALIALLAATGRSTPPAIVTSYRSGRSGTSLVELRDLAARAGLSLRIVQRTNALDVPVPAIVHMKMGHYVAVIQRDGSRYLIEDRGRQVTYWVHRDTLLTEGSGYFLLLNADPTVEGWRTVTDEDATAIRGWGILCPDGSPPPNPPCEGCEGSAGMATYRFQKVTASLLLIDTPVGYVPPRGPAVPLTLSYHHRDGSQPQIFTSSNVGPKWNVAWVRFVQEEPIPNSTPNVWVYQPPGGSEVYSGRDANGVYPAHWSSRAVLVRVSEAPLRYERRLPDGTVEVYARSDGAPVDQRRVYLTELIDPLGQRLQFTWDAQLRLVAITDAIGQVSTLAYEHATDPLKVTKITDPYGRFATLTYNGAGQLASITDVIGLTSEFAYGRNDFVSSLKTPYGLTTFRHEPDDIYALSFRFIEATDPVGGTEHLEYQWETPSLPATALAADVPTGFTEWNLNLDHYNTFYWSKRAWMLGKNDLSKAEVTHWLTKADFVGDSHWASVPHSVKKPLEGRVWYAYPGQAVGSPELGWWRKPSRVGRVLDDGSSQISETTYNDQGSPLTRTDPLGRQTSYAYRADGVTVVDVRQTTGGMNDLLAVYSNFTALNLPQTVSDAAGQTTTMTYNAAGQVLTVTNAKNETTTYAYDTAGRLTTVTGAVAGATTTYTYDGYGRVRTVTDSDTDTVTTDYDVFDRPIRATYPDGGYEETTYDRLDVATRRDRKGRLTRVSYDAMRRVIATQDPAGRVVTQERCACGSLDALIDANGSRTSWERDLQGRVTREVRADGVTDTLYTYGVRTGRLLTVTDPKDQVTTYTYAADDQRLSMTFTNAVIATPSVSFTYDMQYGRLATMTDGIGVTTYSYHAPGLPGAGQVASVDGPLTADTITYTYDELGRVATRAINGSANTVSWGFDALGRVMSETNVLGTFTYAYDGPTPRLATVTYPNGQTSVYSYFGNTADRRLQTIQHKYPNGSTLSTFDYTYDGVGNILTWRQQADATAVNWEYGYDAADQLVSAIKKATDPPQTVLKRYAYAYDPAGNRTVEQIDDQVTGATYNSLNRLVSQQPSGALVFAGTVSEPASVTVQSVPAAVSAANAFQASVPLSSGTNTIAVTARDASGNVATKQYEVDSTGTARTFTYDANGNLTSDGSRTFEWDARNQLVAVTVGTHRSEFTYDGQQRRVRVIEKENGVVQSDTKVVWCQTIICEERASDGTTVTRRAFAEGEQVGGTARYFATDHLGSVSELTDGSATVLTRYAFDPWGARTVTAGTDLTAVGFTGHDWTANGSVWLTMYRAYDPALGRWLSDDPIGLDDGPNMTAYVRNRPTVNWDSLGLQHQPGGPWHPEPPNDQVRCTPADSCPELQRKISTLSDMIRAHRNWDKKRKTNRHAEEIADLTRAIMRCVDIYNSKDCKACNGNENCRKVLQIVGTVLLWVCLKVPGRAPAFP